MAPVSAHRPQRTIHDGLACQKAGNLLGAAQIYSGLIREDPRNADAWHLLGTIELSRGQFNAAHDMIAQALTLRPNNAIYHHNLAFALGAQSRMDEAIASYRRAVALAPDYAEAQFNLAQSLRIEPGDPLIPAVDRLLRKPGLSDRDRCFVEFAAGKVYANLGRHDRAFGHYAAGNAARKATPNPVYGRDFMERILAACDTALLTRKWGGDAPEPTPVFIVGMPRSGTSLVEQVLASHPAVHGGGEMPFIERVCAALPKLVPDRGPYPECLPHAPDAVLADLAQTYLKHATINAGDARIVTDKAPLNFRHLGLIALLFPNARIVHCRRDALDTCLSCFFQNFTQGQDYSFDLESLGGFYRDYRWMMECWTEILPSPVFDLVYEDLVTDLEGVGRRLLAFCGIDWHPDCARFFETERPVLTASRAQVRRPVYTSSIGKWRHYETHLGPLIAALGDFAETAEKG